MIGITSAKVTNTYGEGLGFAIPIDEAIPIVKELIAYGKVTGRPALGATGECVTEVYSQYYDIPKGYLIRSVNSGSCAEKAGIKVNDIITGINGKAIESMEQFNNEKNQYKAGDTVTITVYRDGKYLDIEVTFDEAESETESEDTESRPFGQPFSQEVKEYVSLPLQRRLRYVPPVLLSVPVLIRIQIIEFFLFFHILLLLGKRAVRKGGSFLLFTKFCTGVVRYCLQKKRGAKIAPRFYQAGSQPISKLSVFRSQ